MENALKWLARLAGLGGLALAILAMLARMGNVYTVGRFQTGTLLLVATFAIAFGAFCYAALIAEYRRH